MIFPKISEVLFPIELEIGIFSLISSLKTDARLNSKNSVGSTGRSSSSSSLVFA